MTPVKIIQGAGPILLGMPHGGTFIPEAIEARLNERGKILADTDWWIDRLYEGLCPSATIVKARFHRYVIDANRDPEGGSLYPGQNTTMLCPTTDFDGQPIWRPGEKPDEAEVENRRATYHAAYHAAMAEQIKRIKARHRVAVLYDCHSIRSHIPFLFDGELPVLNLGDNGGKTSAPAFLKAAVDACESSGYTFVLNGRFKGGWTTRHYGRPDAGVHALQMEIAQSSYMEEKPP